MVLTPPVDEEAVGGTRLYTVDLTTGAARPIGAIGRELGVLGLAIGPGGLSTVYGLTDVPELVTFDAADPSTLAAQVPITGVAEGSTLLAIDVRPADGTIVAVSDASVVYTIDPETGVATPVGDAIDPPIEDPGFGLDVNPEVDSSGWPSPPARTCAWTRRPVPSTSTLRSRTAAIRVGGSWRWPTPTPSPGRRRRSCTPSTPPPDHWRWSTHRTTARCRPSDRWASA